MVVWFVFVDFDVGEGGEEVGDVVYVVVVLVGDDVFWYCGVWGGGEIGFEGGDLGWFFFVGVD